ncbi:hypothetical protein B9Z55_028063 [Caenorhabditis nigoni]|uniref:Uncharacterized protein n=1 Tax=Caenorhabditis nigoni TaxID=1611254 RepID=A0A2G5SDI5_9PELO|nr:hypothetical protein B9Z55_028063 [Caenorhabditis nigoni]
MTSPKDKSEDSFSASPPRAPWIIRFDRQQKFEFSPWARRHVPVLTWYTAQLGNIDIYPSNQPPALIQLEGDSMMYHQMWDAPWREIFSSEKPRSFLVVYFQLPMKKMNEEKAAKQKKDQFEYLNQLIRFSLMGHGPVFYFNEMCQNQLGGETWMHECVPFVYWPTDLTRSENSTVPILSIQVPVFEVPSSSASRPSLEAVSGKKDIATVSTEKKDQSAHKSLSKIEHTRKESHGKQEANIALEPETMHPKPIVKADVVKDGPTDMDGFVKDANGHKRNDVEETGSARILQNKMISEDVHSVVPLAIGKCEKLSTSDDKGTSDAFAMKNDSERTSATTKFFSGDVDKENLHQASINKPTKKPRRRKRLEVKKKQKKQQSAALNSKLVDSNPPTLSDDLTNSPSSKRLLHSVDEIGFPSDAIGISKAEEAKRAHNHSIYLESAPVMATQNSSKISGVSIAIPADVPPAANKAPAFTKTYAVSRQPATSKATVASTISVEDKTPTAKNCPIIAEDCAAGKAPAPTRNPAAAENLTITKVSVPAKNDQRCTVETDAVQEDVFSTPHSSDASGDSAIAKTKAPDQSSASGVSSIAMKAIATDKAPAKIPNLAASENSTRTKVSVPAKDNHNSTFEGVLPHSSAQSENSSAAKTGAPVESSSSVVSPDKAPAASETHVSANGASSSSKAIKKNKNKKKKSKNVPKDDFSVELPNKADKKLEDAKLNFSTKFEVYKTKMDNERRFQLAFEKNNFPSHDMQLKIYEYLKQTHSFGIHLRRKEIEEKLEERILLYRSAKCFEYQIMEHVMETLSNCKTNLITGDCLYLYSDESLTEKKLRALEKQYLRMIESCEDWIGNSNRECALTLEDTKKNPVKLRDECWYDHFVTYINRQALLRTDDNPCNPPDAKIEELISQMHDEESFVYKLFSDFEEPVEWNSLTTKIFITMRRNNLINLANISVQERERFKKFYTFLLATKSSIVDFDIFQMFGRVSTQDLSKFKTDPYIEKSLFRLFFNYPHSQV